jgi:hypothetical protein
MQEIEPNTFDEEVDFPALTEEDKQRLGDPNSHVSDIVKSSKQTVADLRDKLAGTMKKFQDLKGKP